MSSKDQMDQVGGGLLSPTWSTSMGVADCCEVEPEAGEAEAAGLLAVGVSFFQFLRSEMGQECASGHRREEERVDEHEHEHGDEHGPQAVAELQEASAQRRDGGSLAAVSAAEALASPSACLRGPSPCSARRTPSTARQ